MTNLGKPAAEYLAGGYGRQIFPTSRRVPQGANFFRAQLVGIWRGHEQEA